MRDYGYGKCPDAAEPPVVVEEVGIDCPNCGCTSTVRIEAKYKNIDRLGGDAIGTYVGCPACPFASPQVMRKA